MHVSARPHVDVGKRLRWLRERMKLSQAEIADNIGASPSQAVLWGGRSCSQARWRPVGRPGGRKAQ